MPKADSYLYLKILAVFLVFATIASVSVKVFNLVKTSSFNHNSFNVLVLSKDTFVFHLDTINKKIYVLNVGGSNKALLKKSRIYDSEALGVLIDGVVEARSGVDISPNDFVAGKNFSNLLFDSGDYHLQNINALDFLKLYFYSKSADQINYGSQKIDIKNLPQDLLQTVGTSAFKDQELIDSKASAQVVNATDINGLGTEFAIALKSVGYNIVGVESSDTQDSSVIMASDKEDIATRRIQDAFALPVKLSQNSDADVVFVIGTDIAK
ncbi:MAG TPA: LytR C-terminal domain-containing protein [Patescibacteria group bacterium]|nr:LytR C-terminal domain-containing protein [Patescibacteria group bacterium]